MTAAHFQDLLLEPADNERLANLCGQLDEHLRQIERRVGVRTPRGCSCRSAAGGAVSKHS